MSDLDSERHERRREARLNLIFVLLALGFSALFDGLAAILLPNNPIGKISDGIIFLAVAGYLLYGYTRPSVKVKNPESPANQAVGLEKRLEDEVRSHLKRYVDRYDAKKDKEGLDLLEDKVGDHHAIDRDLMSFLLSLKLEKSNNRLQWAVVIIALASLASTVVEIWKVLS
jgi:hypothetical protein